jgi:uncharacterized protein with HEPN domain
MNDKSSKFLTDISIAIQHIEEFCKDTPSFNLYQNDYKTKSAVERQLAIIGEAVNKLTQSDPDINLSKAKEIINFRNRAIHAYDSIDDSIVWVILKNHLPVLKAEVANLLS